MADSQIKTVNDWGQDSTSYTYSNPHGKIRLTQQPTFSTHRSGWAYAIDSLSSLHNPSGVSFYGFLENEFYWQKDKTTLPFQHPWVGFLHNPQNYPWWFGPKGLPEVVVNSSEFQDSLECCRGLFTLTKHHADFLREFVDVPVNVLYHPSEIPEKQFSFEAFMRNAQKRILNVGYWLRKVNSIYYLPIDNSIYTKTKLLPYKEGSEPHKFVHSLREKELKFQHETALEYNYYYHESTSCVEELFSLTNDEYDDMFCDNIIYLDMYTCSASNSIIESIARATPILVNPIPPAIEYLGLDYPFYFRTIEEAIDKAFNMELIRQSHEYLKTCEMRKKLTGDYFLEDFKRSEIYESI